MPAKYAELCELSKYVRGSGKTRYDLIAALVG
jgi:hypothetical protein